MSFQSSITEYDNSTNCSSICLNNNLKKLEKDIPVPIIENNTTKAEDEYVPYSKNTNVDTKNTTDNNKYSLAEINKRLELISKKYGIECKIDILLNILGIEDKKDLDLDITKVNNLMNVLDAALAECKDKKTGNADINRAIELSKQKYNTEAKAVTNDTNNKTLNELLGLPDNATNDDIEVEVTEVPGKGHEGMHNELLEKGYERETIIMEDTSYEVYYKNENGYTNYMGFKDGYRTWTYKSNEYSVSNGTGKLIYVDETDNKYIYVKNSLEGMSKIDIITGEVKWTQKGGLENSYYFNEARCGKDLYTISEDEGLVNIIDKENGNIKKTVKIYGTYTIEQIMDNELVLVPMVGGHRMFIDLDTYELHM